MGEPYLVKEVSYTVRDTNLDEACSDEPQVEGLLDEVASLLQLVREARAKLPADVRMLERSEVPLPPLTRDDCYFCSYTKVVNFMTVEHYEDGPRGCGDCGYHVKSHQIVKDFKTVEVVVESWGMIHRPPPVL